MGSYYGHIGGKFLRIEIGGFVSPEQVLTIAQQGLQLTAMMAAPILITVLAVGLIVSMVQAATQINEMTLSFVPKLAAIGVVLVVAGPWILQSIIDFTISLYKSIPYIIGG